MRCKFKVAAHEYKLAHRFDSMQLNENQEEIFSFAAVIEMT